MMTTLLFLSLMSLSYVSPSRHLRAFKSNVGLHLQMKNLRLTDISLSYFDTKTNSRFDNCVTRLLEPELPQYRRIYASSWHLIFLPIILLNHIFNFSHSSRNVWFHLDIFTSFTLPQNPHPIEKC